MKRDSINRSGTTFDHRTRQRHCISDYCEQPNSVQLNMVWYKWLASWVSSGGFDNATLVGYGNHITNEVTHYKSKCNGEIGIYISICTQTDTMQHGM